MKLARKRGKKRWGRKARLEFRMEREIRGRKGEEKRREKRRGKG